MNWMRRAAWSIAAALMCAAAARAEVKLHGLFSDGVVLQRGAAVPVWGTAAAGEKVKVSVAGRTAEATADAAGKWRAELSDLPAGGPHTLVVEGANRVEVKDVLVGDVWLCSGQSNMAYGMSALKSTPYAPDLESANFPQIRQFAVPRDPTDTPRDDVKAKWVACKPETVGGFTAAGFYFARDVHKELGVPIGLIHSSWGGTSAEAWTSLPAISTVADFKARYDEQSANIKSLPERIKTFPEQIAAWERANGRVDTDNQGEAQGWAAVDCPAEGWKSIKFRQKWREVGVASGGVVWLRKEIDLPASAAGREFRLDLGSVEDMYETTYFNGEKLGSSGREPPQFYNRYQGYNVPGRLVKAGKNVFAIRLVTPEAGGTVMNRAGSGFGFVTLGVRDPGDDVLMRVETEFAPLSKEAAAARPPTPKGNPQGVASYLYNGMIHPLAPYALKGVLWYQGEQDAGRAYAYRTMLPLMIGDWRERWGRADLPFVVQQLPNWKADGADKTGWAELREAQWMTASAVPNVHISCAIDVGDSNDVHPQNKRDVGKRLALVAMAQVYGKDVKFTGPRFKAMRVDGDTVRLTFDHADGLRSADGKPLGGFTISGDDQKFVTATATIDGNEVVVRASGVAKPAAVRYAFINDPVAANLTNASGLPALPFRTDTWPGATAGRK
jgi:sialate O-acetylesterase